MFHYEVISKWKYRLKSIFNLQTWKETVNTEIFLYSSRNPFFMNSIIARKIIVNKLLIYWKKMIDDAHVFDAQPKILH